MGAARLTVPRRWSDLSGVERVGLYTRVSLYVVLLSFNALVLLASAGDDDDHAVPLLAGGAVVAALLSVAGAGATVEWAAFLVVSVVLLAALRPIAREHQRSKGKVKMNTAALVGQTAMVVERIANAEGVGCVKLDGEIWTARAFDDDEVIEPGTRVHVLEIRGATALVSQ